MQALRKAVRGQRGGEEISADDVKIPAAHTLGELVPRKNATCVADGGAHYRCTECGAYFDADDTTTPVEYSFSLIIPSKDGAHDSPGHRRRAVVHR